MVLQLKDKTKMEKYKCNLDLVWNLPRGVQFLSDKEGKHCAIGKVCAGILGRPLVGINDIIPSLRVDDPQLKLLLRDLREKGGRALSSEIWALNDKGGKENHEKAIKLCLQYLMEAGVIELEDSDLEIVRELKEIAAAKEKVNV